MDYRIYVAQISLHYESRPTIIHLWTRERYARALWERKQKPGDWYYRRVTERKADEMREDAAVERLRQQYDRAIQEKYGVGAGWKQDRYFMEQVRPTLCR